MISNGSFVFKDIQSYLSPFTSLDQFLKAFDTEVTKAVFPHKITQDINKYVKDYPNLSIYTDNVIELLKHSSIPSKDWFQNELKGTAISNEGIRKGSHTNYLILKSAFSDPPKRTPYFHN
jgi:hypothetical protein